VSPAKQPDAAHRQVERLDAESGGDRRVLLEARHRYPCVEHKWSDRLPDQRSGRRIGILRGGRARERHQAEREHHEHAESSHHGRL
jgi:hypothetical protein